MGHIPQNKIDLTGRRFGRLTVIAEMKVKKWISSWECKCDCGSTKITRAYYLTSGRIRSCGCLRLDTLKGRAKHRDCNSKEYQTWANIKQRCYYPKHNRFKNYGGRGISVCKRWMVSYENFLTDMGRAPGSHYSIERKNNNGNYTKSNCKWATRKEQCENRTTTIHICVNGEKLNLRDWSKKLNITPSAFYYWFNKGWSYKKTINYFLTIVKKNTIQEVGAGGSIFAAK